jgi:N-acetylglucosaminyldiphosphoundecaprenol N-acetyl-beta-D-mannosaminyltransferase
LILERIEQREKTFCVAINPEKIYRAQTDPSLCALIEQANVHICDGVGAAIAARLLYGQRVARITGVQLFLDLIAAAEVHGLRVYLLGASSASNKLACCRLRQQHPRLMIAGNRDGFFSDHGAVVAEINACAADMVFVAMGSPRQEKWIAEHRARIEAPFCMGVGGTFDVVSGQVPRAPAICRRTGTEFLYRLAREPKRWKRQLCLPLFMAAVLRAALFGSAAAANTVALPMSAGVTRDRPRKAA